MLSKNVGEAMDAIGAAFKALGSPGGFSIYGLRVLDREGRLVATLAPGGDGGGELVLYHPETGRQLAFRPVAP